VQDHDEGHTLRELRRSLPPDVLVTARAHPLVGARLVVEGWRTVGGVVCLIVRLPDGSASMIAAAATDVAAGASPDEASSAAAAGRRLRALLELRVSDGSGT